MDGSGGDFFKISSSFDPFVGDADTTAPRTDGIGASRAMIPFVEDPQRATAQDYIILTSDANR
jgi:hypothetical protein